VILDHGAREMLQERRDVFYYITVVNENYEHPPLPAASREGVIKGIYLYAEQLPTAPRARVHLLGSGAIFREVIAAGWLLDQDWQVGSDVWSVTSFSELAREAHGVERLNRLHPEATPKTSYVANVLRCPNPVIAASDYVVAYPQLIRPYVANPFTALGTDGFGRSDTREALRRFFEVDRYHIVAAALGSLGLPELAAQAIRQYGINAESAAPWGV
jgi:pyruvate dehydrogenase E1 component